MGVTGSTPATNRGTGTNASAKFAGYFCPHKPGHWGVASASGAGADGRAVQVPCGKCSEDATRDNKGKRSVKRYTVYDGGTAFSVDGCPAGWVALRDTKQLAQDAVDAEKAARGVP